MMYTHRHVFSLLLPAAFYILFLLGLSAQPLSAESLRCRLLSGLAPKEPMALVIVNSKYGKRRLWHAINDAKALKKVLTELDFKVIFKQDLDKKAMRKVILEFSICLTNIQGIGLFYFTGYGTQLDGKNYLLPLETSFEGKDSPLDTIEGEIAQITIDVEEETFKVSELFKRLEAANNILNIVILDVCRHNPYLPFISSPGLASTEAPSGFLIAYSADANQTCQEKFGAINSLYIRELIKALKNAKQNHTRIVDVFRQVAKVVRRESHELQQKPWHRNSSEETVCVGEKTVGVGECPILLTVRSNVSGATVIIDGTTPINYRDEQLVVELLKGWHTVRVEKNGYIPFEETFYLQREQQLFAKLVKKIKQVKLSIHFSNVNSATVLINEKTYGVIRDGWINLELPVGKYTVTVEKSGYVSYKKSINLQEERDIDVYLHKRSMF